MRYRAGVAIRHGVRTIIAGMNTPASKSTAPARVPRFDPLSRLLHWLTALIVLAAFILGPEGFGRLMRQHVDPATRADIVWHETLGATIFVLTLVRLLWLAWRPAAPQVPMAPLMRRASKAVQGLLWLLMILLPLTAVLSLSRDQAPLTLLGDLRLDAIPFLAGSALARLADWGDVHGFLGDAILVLAGIHAVAAIYHHFVLKDDVLRTMLPPGIGD